MRNSKKQISQLALFVSLTPFMIAIPAFAQTAIDLNTILVTPSFSPILASETGSATTVITAKELEQRKTQLVAEILREVPGFAVSNAGQPGALTQIRVRGSEANHVMVLIDGIEANDPRTGSEFDFGQLLAGDIERIEIIRGPQSALYGSDALSGVINIITKKGRGPLAFRGTVEVGSFQTYLMRAGLNFGNEYGHIDFNATKFETAGINVSRLGKENDGTKNYTIHGKAGIKPRRNIELNTVVRYTRTESESDPQDFAFPATPTLGQFIDGDDLSDQRFFYGKFDAKISTFDGALNNRFTFGATDSSLDFFTDGVRLNSATSSRYKYSYQGNVKLNTPSLAGIKHNFSVLAEREDLRFKNNPNPAFFFAAADLAAAKKLRKDHQNSVAGEYRISLFNQLFLSAGFRHDDNQRFKNANTHRFTGAYKFAPTLTRIHMSYGTGIKNPSFIELFGFNPNQHIGNPALKPETSKSYDIGIEQRLFENRLVFDVTHFHAKLKGEITTIGFAPGRSINLAGNSARKGIEISATVRPWSNVTLKAAYTYVSSRQPLGREEIRRPKHIASANLVYLFHGGRGNFNTGINFNGKQKDTDFGTGSRVTLKDYTLVKAALSYALTDQMTVYGRVENLLNQNYEQVFSQKSPGIAAYIGAKIKLGPGFPGSGR